MKRYTVNEVFYSIQGEGVRAGTANVFIRFTGCNMRCDIEPGTRSPGEFACDTEFESGRKVTLGELDEWIDTTCNGTIPEWFILTGGEPALQIDRAFIDHYRGKRRKLAIETNGSIALVDGFDWMTVSPKVAEHAIRQRTAHEVKYVRGYGQAVPKAVVKAEHYLISPAFSGMNVDPKALDWCIGLVKENPAWSLTVQMHKLWRVA